MMQILYDINGYTGIVGKSVFTNLEEAIQAAKDDTIVKIGAGTYELTNTVRIDKRVNLIGDSADKSIVVGHIQYVFGCDQYGNTITVQGLTIQASENNNLQGLQFCGERPNSGYNLKIEVSDCAFSGWTYAIAMNSHANGYFMTINDCDFSRSFYAVNYNYDVDTVGQQADNSLLFTGNNIIAENGFAVEKFNNGVGDSLDQKTYLTIEDFENDTPLSGVAKYVRTERDLINTIAAAGNGDIVVLGNDIMLGCMLDVKTNGITLNLNGYTITASDTFTGSYDNDKHLVNVTGDNITIKNGTLKTTEANKHVLNLYGTSNVVLEDLVLDHTNAFTGAPLVVNGSTVTIQGNFEMITGEKSWYAMNVDNKIINDSGANTNVTFANNAMVTFTGEKKIGIFMEASEDNASVTVTFNPYAAFKMPSDFVLYYFNPNEDSITVSLPAFVLQHNNNGSVTYTYYPTEDEAIANAQPGDVVLSTSNTNTEKFDVTVKNGDEIVATDKVVANGKYILPAAPSRAGYSFRGWYGNGHLYAAGEAVQITKDTTFVAQWSDNTPYYTITVKDADNGTVTCYAKSAAKGADVTLTVKADVGYQLDKLTVTDASGNVIDVEKVNNTTYTLQNPICAKRERPPGPLPFCSS